MNELREIGWNAKSDELPNGVKLTVTANEEQPLTKLKALGFMGIMVQGGHHQPHHLMIAMGQFRDITKASLVRQTILVATRWS